MIVNGELILTGNVGALDYFEDGFTYADVIMAMPSFAGKDMVVRINSGGGIATEGVAIYNALQAHKGRVTVYIEGIAASAASIIAMAGDEIIMKRGALMMIHDPMTFAMGNADDMESALAGLNAMADAMASIYADKTGRSIEDIRADMKEEIWLTAENAIFKGYATKTDDAAAIEVTAFDYRAYSKAPEVILAISDQRKWSNRLKAEATKPKVTTKDDKPMKTPEQIAAEAAADAEAKFKAETDRAAALSTLCITAGVPAMIAGFIRDGITVEAAQLRITAETGRIKAIRDKVEQARKVQPLIEANLADTFIAAGSSPDTVADDLLNRISALSAAAPQRSQHQAGNPDDQAAVTAMTDKIVANINKRFG